jgi:hypothetical protein
MAISAPYTAYVEPIGIAHQQGVSVVTDVCCGTVLASRVQQVKQTVQHVLACPGPQGSSPRPMRPRPLDHPSATLAGAAPTLDGRWLSAWTTPDGALCVTLGAVPGDACTSRPGARHGGEAAARVAARDRLDRQWNEYAADRAVPAKRSASRRPLRCSSGWIRDAVPVNEGPAGATEPGPPSSRWASSAIGPSGPRT